jgi:outer membrane receptor protein involved in Fe transport
VFHREISDVIETRATGEVIGGRRVEQVQNVGNGWLRGLELEQRLSLAPTGVPFIEGFTLTANQSFLDSELRSYSGTVAPFKEQPDFFGNFILDWEDTGLGTSVSAAASYVSRIENSTNGDGRGSEFFLDLQVSQRIIPGIEAYFRVTNLTEQARDKIKADGSFELEEASSYYYVGLRAVF